MTKGRRGRRDRNVASISCPHLLALFSLRKTLSLAAANQNDKAFILPLINSIHRAIRQRRCVFTLPHSESHLVIVEDLLSAGPDVQRCEEGIFPVRCRLCFSFVKTAASCCIRLPTVLWGEKIFWFKSLNIAITLQ